MPSALAVYPPSFGLATRAKFYAFAGAAFWGTFWNKLCIIEKQPSYGQIIAEASAAARDCTPINHGEGRRFSCKLSTNWLLGSTTIWCWRQLPQLTSYGGGVGADFDVMQLLCGLTWMTTSTRNALVKKKKKKRITQEGIEPTMSNFSRVVLTTRPYLRLIVRDMLDYYYERLSSEFW